MIPPSSRNFLRNRLGSLAQRLGLADPSNEKITQRASQLKLPFTALPSRTFNIACNNEPDLRHLADLPRGALYGPVQEDKSEAHAVLVRLVEHQQSALQAFDLRQIEGLACCPAEYLHYNSFENLAASEACRKIRIISYNDFVRTLSLALPGYATGEPVQLMQASWYGKRLYWAGDQHMDALACAVAYARRRELEIKLPAQVSRYTLNAQGLKALHQHYHALALPGAAWNDPDFMALLLDTGTPYARLKFSQAPGAPDILLLPKHKPQSAALGEGLLIAGAPDAYRYLSSFLRPL